VPVQEIEGRTVEALPPDPLPEGKPDFTSEARRRGALRDQLGQPVTGPFFGDVRPRTGVAAPRPADAGTVEEWEAAARGPSGPDASGILSGIKDLSGTVVRGGRNLARSAADLGGDVVDWGAERLGTINLPDILPHADPSFRTGDAESEIMGGHIPPRVNLRDIEKLETAGMDVGGGDTTPLYEEAPVVEEAPPSTAEVVASVTGDGEAAAAAVDVVPLVTIAKEEKRAQESAAELFALHPQLQRTLEGGGVAEHKIAAKLVVSGDPTTGVRMPEFVLSEKPVPVKEIQKDVLSVNDLAQVFPIGSSLDITGIETSIADSKKYATEKLEELAVKMDEYASSKPSKSTNDIIKRYQDRLDALRRDPLPFFRAAAAVMKGRQEGLVPFISAMTGYSEGNEELKKQMLPLIDKMTEIELANAEIEAAKKATILKMNGELRQAMIAARQGDTANEISLMKVVQQDKNSMLTFQAALDRNAITAKGYMMQYLGTDAALMDRLQESMQASGDPVANGLMYEAGRDKAGRQILKPTMLGWEWITKAVRDTKSTSGTYAGATFGLSLEGRAQKVTEALEKYFGTNESNKLWGNTEFRQWATEQGYNMGNAFSTNNEHKDEIKNAMMTWWLTKGSGPASAQIFANQPIHKNMRDQILALWAPSGGGSSAGGDKPALTTFN